MKAVQVTTADRGGPGAALPVRGPACREPRTGQARLAAGPGAVQQARRETREALSAWQLTGLQETAALIVSEVVTNAIRHASAGGAEAGLRL
jgi:hypothetical protein